MGVRHRRCRTIRSALGSGRLDRDVVDDAERAVKEPLVWIASVGDDIAHRKPGFLIDVEGLHIRRRGALTLRLWPLLLARRWKISSKDCKTPSIDDLLAPHS